MTLQLWNLTSTFSRSRAASAYSAGQLVSSNTSTGFSPLQFQIGGNSQPGQTRITRCRIQKSSTGVSGATFRLHLYGAAPLSTAVDGGTWLTDTSAQYLGGFDVASMYQFSDDAANIGQPTTGNGNDVLVRLNSGKTIYGIGGARQLHAYGQRKLPMHVGVPRRLLDPCGAFPLLNWRG
jgi:hypothetical protein